MASYLISSYKGSNDRWAQPKETIIQSNDKPLLVILATIKHALISIIIRVLGYKQVGIFICY